MIADIWTVMWKEWQEILHQRGSVRRTALNWLAIIAVLAIFSPWVAGRDWVKPEVSFHYWILLPSLLIWGTIPDSFAGERERHTLATILASRLSDRAILLGKIAAAVSHACGLTLVFFLLALVEVNFRYWGGSLLLYPVGSFNAGIAVSLFTTTLIASIGVLVSLHAETVKQAALNLIQANILILGVLFASLLLLLRFIKLKVVILKFVSPTQVVLIALAILIVLDLLVIALAMARFQRTQLILD